MKLLTLSTPSPQRPPGRCLYKQSEVDLVVATGEVAHNSELWGRSLRGWLERVDWIWAHVK